MTWFDMGQTTDSFYTLNPHQADRTVKIRLISIEKVGGIVAETDVDIERNPETSKPVNSGFLSSNETRKFVETSNSNQTVFIILAVLISIFVIMTVLLIVMKRKLVCSTLKSLTKQKSKEVTKIDENLNNRFVYYVEAEVPIKSEPLNNLSFYL
jgi:hypothetical protein